jgi:hypothetical protein
MCQGSGRLYSLLNLDGTWEYLDHKLAFRRWQEALRPIVRPLGPRARWEEYLEKSNRLHGR